MHANNPIMHGSCNDTSIEKINQVNAWNGILEFLTTAARTNC